MLRELRLFLSDFSVEGGGGYKGLCDQLWKVLPFEEEGGDVAS